MPAVSLKTFSAHYCLRLIFISIFESAMWHTKRVLLQGAHCVRPRFHHFGMICHHFKWTLRVSSNTDGLREFNGHDFFCDYDILDDSCCEFLKIKYDQHKRHAYCILWWFSTFELGWRCQQHNGQEVFELTQEIKCILCADCFMRASASVDLELLFAFRFSGYSISKLIRLHSKYAHA